MRLTIVQYAGDYREAWQRFDRGGKATYQAQRYSVDLVGKLAQRLEQVVVVCALTDEPYDVVLPNKVRSIGAGLKLGFRPRDILPLLATTAPDRIVLTTPMVALLKWSRKQRVRTITALADSFRKGRSRKWIAHRLLASELNSANVDWVGNHQVAACLSLVDIGVQPDKIVPWDWPPSHCPSDHAPRELSPGQSLKLVYVGSVEEAKGVGDLLRALQQLKSSGERHEVAVIGLDRDGSMESLAASLCLDEQVRFAGVVPNEDVPYAMRQADAVIIPSRREYPEGLPLTIYEALAARTPIIASDHPMFRGSLVHEESALIFPAGQSEALAAAIRRLNGDGELYARLSRNSIAAWEALQLPVTWGDLIEKWLSDEPSDREWLFAHRLNSGLYDRQIEVRRSA
jgi:glycosyltransferase involved in cell wall biosynthesis